MAEDLLALSASILDNADTSIETMRVTNQLSEVAGSIGFIESFSNSIVFDTDEGLVVFDTATELLGRGVVESLRGWSDRPLHSLVYTHGHIDHVGGSAALLQDNETRHGASGARRVEIVGHERVAARFSRYRLTEGYNVAINARQFGRGMLGMGFLPGDVAEVTNSFQTTSRLEAGNLTFELHHALGETDDHCWAWIESMRAICVGDLMIWRFPNAGNPQKVQRYPLEWAGALREMAALEPELLLPAHGLPIFGVERVGAVLNTIAGVLEKLVSEVVAAMNSGATLDEILAEVKVDPDMLKLPYLIPTYDEPEFVIRNIWRLYGGWYDGNPARLKPPTDLGLAQEVCQLAGGVEQLVARAVSVADSGDYRMACQLAEWAYLAFPNNAETREAMSHVYGARLAGETSLMAKGIFRSAAQRGLPE